MKSHKHLYAKYISLKTAIHLCVCISVGALIYSVFCTVLVTVVSWLLLDQSYGILHANSINVVDLYRRKFCDGHSILVFFVVAGKISASWWSSFKNFLNPHVVNLSVRLFYILFSYNFRKIVKWLGNFGMFLNYIGLFYIKKCYCIVHRSFYRAIQKFHYINIFCSFLIT